jgi:hypothetical protein
MSQLSVGLMTSQQRLQQVLSWIPTQTMRQHQQVNYR